MYIIRTTIDILTLLGLPNYGTHYHRKSSRFPHLICLKKGLFNIYVSKRSGYTPPG